MKIGSEAHKELFCGSFLESYQEYDPQQLTWPQLDDTALALLRGIPFWGEALTVEVKAGAMVSAFAEATSDPVLREAITLQGKEETRHARLLEAMIQHYGITGVETPTAQLPSNLKTAFLDLGHEECLDSFLAFGFFDIARQAGVFPEGMFAIFEAILDEEARHIVFFANWMAYTQINQGQGAEVVRGTRSLWYYARAMNRLVSSISKGNTNGPGFMVSGASAFPFEITPQRFLSTCLSENDRRLSRFDERLLRPQLMPVIATWGMRSLKLLSRSKSTPDQPPNSN